MTEYTIEEVLSGVSDADVVDQPVEREMVEIESVELTEEEIETARQIRKEHQAEGTKRSWANPDVAAARKIRRGCSVLTPEGERYRFDSVCSAFEFFKISNVSKHIAFRKELRSVEGQTLGVTLEDGIILEFTDIPVEKTVKVAKVKEPKLKEGDEGYVAPEPKEKKARKKKTVAVAENVIPETAESVEVEACFE